jgi:hypothetical protein
MAGSFTYTPAPKASSYTPTMPLIAVLRFDTAFGANLYSYLPNVRCLSIRFSEGPSPPVAKFRYVFGDPLGDPNDPGRVEDVFPTSFFQNTVAAGERLVVRMYLADGTWELLFDGFSLIPQIDLGRNQELATFEAIGTPIREWDRPIAGAIYRDGEDPDVVKDVPTDHDVRFNPDKHPNAGPKDHDTRQGETDARPAFLDWRLKRKPDPRRYWTLGMAVRHILFNYMNKTQPAAFPIGMPTANAIDGLLESRVPTPDPLGTIDPNDPATFDDFPILVADLNVNGDAWPEALQKLIEPHGFGFNFVLDTDEAGDPSWRVNLYRKDVGYPLKYADLPRAGTLYKPKGSNIVWIGIQRDLRNVVNRIDVDTEEVEWEVSAVLAPGWTPDAADAAEANIPKFSSEDPDNDLVDYRIFVLDEAGDGHYDFASSTFVEKQATPLGDIFGKPSKDGTPAYVHLNRPGDGQLLLKDKKGQYLQAQLYISTDYEGRSPGLWDRTGTWRKVTQGWSLLPDRIGIRISAKNPEEWSIGGKLPDGPFADGKVRVVTAMAAPDPNQADATKFFLRLTTTIRADKDMGISAGRRAASPLTDEVGRVLDARDRWVKQIQHSSSHLNTSGSNQTVKDDTDDATHYAEAYRKATELGRVAGSFTVPRISGAYRIGDKIAGLRGRNIDLTENAGAPLGEAPIYPVVVGLAYTLEGGDAPSTTFELSDHRAPPPGEHRS